jgi:hypothetical protein
MILFMLQGSVGIPLKFYENWYKNAIRCQNLYNLVLKWRCQWLFIQTVDLFNQRTVEPNVLIHTQSEVNIENMSACILSLNTWNKDTVHDTWYQCNASESINHFTYFFAIYLLWFQRGLHPKFWGVGDTGSIHYKIIIDFYDMLLKRATFF